MSTCGSKNDDDNADKAIEGGEGDDKLVGMGGEDEMYGDDCYSDIDSDAGDDDVIFGSVNESTKSISETILANAKEIICHSKLSEYFDGETDEFPCGCSGMCNAYADSTACVLESWKCFWKEMHETRRGIIENFSAR